MASARRPASWNTSSTALGLTEVVVDGLRVRAAAADLPALLAATDAVATATRVVHQYRAMTRELDATAAELAQATATLDALVKRSVSSAGSTAAVARAAERLAATPPEDAARAGRALRELARPSEPRVRTPRVKPPVKGAVKGFWWCHKCKELNPPHLWMCDNCCHHRCDDCRER